MPSGLSKEESVCRELVMVFKPEGISEASRENL
jgi:hypothetical protein